MTNNNEVLNFENNLINSSLILSSPHSGSFYPEEFKSLLNIELSELYQNEDSLVDSLINGWPLLGSERQLVLSKGSKMTDNAKQ